jgi:hypothetical protein
MLRITKNYFLPKDAHLNEFETHFVLVTEQTKNLCKMAETYAATSELSGQLKEEEVINNFGPIVARNDKKTTKTKHTRYASVVTSSVITLAQKILSPLTRPVELEGISKELIDFVKSIASEFKELAFPDWFSDPDRKKRVRLNIVFKDTLDSSRFWACVPFTKLSALSCSTDKISILINNIFHAVFSRYKSEVSIISSKNGLNEVNYGGEIQEIITLNK